MKKNLTAQESYNAVEAAVTRYRAAPPGSVEERSALEALSALTTDSRLTQEARNWAAAWVAWERAATTAAEWVEVEMAAAEWETAAAKKAAEAAEEEAAMARTHLCRQTLQPILGLLGLEEEVKVEKEAAEAEAEGGKGGVR